MNINHIGKINRYTVFENNYENSLHLSGSLDLDNNGWTACITKINRLTVYSSDQMLNLMRVTDECCSHHLIGDKLYKIYVEIAPENELILERNSSEWDSNTSHVDFDIPDVIWCFLIGQLTTIL